MTTKTIPVAQPTLPPLEEFLPYLEKIWESKLLTNSGPFHQQLEKKLCEYLGVEHISLFSSGTSALIAALKVLHLSGEVITTPFSFAATTQSLLWIGLKPVFVDIDPNSCNLDSEKIEEAITEHTCAILPVHCYGNTCEVEKIKQIADKHGLKVLYDAAHAFGVDYNNSSVLKHGDLSVLSFHATKVFSTFEGGAIVSPNAKTKLEIDRIKNFGIVDELNVSGMGFNGKLNEVSAAFGLTQLKHIDAAIASRKKLTLMYREKLFNIDGIRCMQDQPSDRPNYSYFPIFVEKNFSINRDELYEKLKLNNITSRRYFYPLLSDISICKQEENLKTASTPVAKKIAEEILCLPMYPDLQESDLDKIVNIIGA